MSPSPPAERPRLEPGECDPTVRHSGVLLAGSASGLRIDDVEIEDAEATGLSLDGGAVTRLVLADVVARTVSLVEVDLSDGRWERVTVEGSRWASCSVDGTTWEDVTLTDVRTPRLSARQATWRRVAFTGCDLTALDLTGARLDGVRFENCTVSEAEFAAATIKRAEFVDCDLSGARTISSLRGATVDASSLASLSGAMAASLGIKVAQPR